MSPEREKVVDRLKKIRAMAEGAAAIGSEAEAQAFAEMLQKMLFQHKLSMSDIEFAQMERDEPVIQRAVVYPPNPEAARNYGNHRKTRVLWMERLAQTIAKAHFCSIVVYSNSSKLGLIGRPDDIAVAEYMIVILQRAADKLGYNAKQDYKAELARKGIHVSAAAGFRESWLLAFTQRLSQRYREEKEAQTTGQSTALVRVNKAEEAVRDFIAEMMASKTLGASKALSRTAAHNREGTQRGTAAANKVDLRANAIKDGGEIKRLS